MANPAFLIVLCSLAPYVIPSPVHQFTGSTFTQDQSVRLLRIEERVSAGDECVSGQPGEKVECGYLGINSMDCEGLGCCWLPNDNKGEPWCFEPFNDGSGLEDISSGGEQGSGSPVSGVDIIKEECGSPAYKPDWSRKIVGGTEAIPNSWPWQVAILTEFEELMCGGSLINANWVLSAAHCTPWVGGSITAGEHSLENFSSSEQTRLITLAVPHPDHAIDWDNAVYHDIVLLKVDEPFVFGDAVSPVCLPPSGDQEVEGTECYTTGWGRLEDSGRTPDELYQVRVPLIDRDTCNQPDWYNGSVTENMICSGFAEGGHDSCEGDSGGPLVCETGPGDRFELKGITSWGWVCGCEKHPGVYTKVANYIKWIEETIRIHS